MTPPLDRPIWSALNGRQAEFAIGDARALRYAADVEPFASTANDDPEYLAALAELIDGRDPVLLIQATPSPLPPGTRLLGAALGVQMLADGPVAGSRPAEAIALGDADSPEMIALAELTRPGPFRARTHHLGQFWGVRREGWLVAMAGERMKLPGMSELSGVCVHPEWRGHGFARALSAFVANSIQQRGETPFLHAYADNVAAIALYEQLGFRLRAHMHVQQLASDS
ncbi:MAG TPA: GNAT family N-acetyltransferase [Sphingomicrobium sp.]|nr:GNAT family N-acetyltransferase [Sphingomicrobium sp.]